MAKHIDHEGGARPSSVPSERQNRAPGQSPSSPGISATGSSESYAPGTGTSAAPAAAHKPVTPHAPVTDAAPPGVMDQAREQAKTLAAEAKEQTAELAGQATQQFSTLITAQKDRAADRLRSVAGVLRETAQKLGTDDVGRGIGRYARQAADQVDSLSTYARATDAETFLRDTGQFARRRPEVFVGGTFITGLLAGRVLRASSRNAPQARTGPGGR